MSDRIILDFEKNEIVWDTDCQQGSEICSDLKDRKEAILKAMGYSIVDVSSTINAFNSFVNGEISSEEMREKLAEFLKDERVEYRKAT